LLEWCLDTLCNNRPLVSLPPLEYINIHYGSMSANTFARILQACQPAIFTFLGDMNQGSLASSNDAVEHIRSAVSTSTSLRKLSLAVRSPNVDAHCAIIEALPHHVTLERRAIFSAPLNGRSVPQQLLDCLLPRLENHLIALEQIELSDFIWTETTISILDHFLPYHSDSLNFLKWFFGQNIMKNSNF
jgi:hypothetical protein